MAKDPAVLFYYQDFLVGTEFMDDNEVGIYIRLLCHLYDKEELSEKQVLSICKASAFSEIPDDIKIKLKKNGDGLYYNERARNEKEKRRAFSESRRKNALGVKGDKAYAKHMEDESINEDEYDDVIKNMVSEFYEFKETQTKLLNGWQDDESLLIGSYDVIDKLHRLDGFSYDDIKLILKNSLVDDFWKKQIISLKGLRVKSKNGLTKFQNASTKLLTKDVFDEWEEKYGTK